MVERKKTLLVVDDEPEIVTMIRLAVEREGYLVLDAPDGQAGLQMLGIEPPNPQVKLPDLVILDIMMPFVDGFTLYTKMQAHKRTRQIPVLVLTARGQALRDLFATAPNLAAYMPKPFDPKALRDAVVRMLEKKGPA